MIPYAEPPKTKKYLFCNEVHDIKALAEGPIVGLTLKSNNVVHVPARLKILPSKSKAGR